MPVIAICNQKGGVGKTTTVYHLIYAAIRRGLRVLAVDLDPQGNLTSVLARDDLPKDQAGVADALSERAPETLDDVIVPGVWEGVDLAPTCGDTLAVVRDELIVTPMNREHRLADLLRPLAGRYDLTVIDCAPALDQLTINALTAADQVLVVTQPRLFSSNGLDKLLDTVAQVGRYYNPALRVAGIQPNLCGRTLNDKTWMSDLGVQAKNRGLRLFDPVPNWVVIADAAEASTGLDQYPADKAPAAAAMYAGRLCDLLGVS